MTSGVIYQNKKQLPQKIIKHSLSLEYTGYQGTSIWKFVGKKKTKLIPLDLKGKITSHTIFKVWRPKDVGVKWEMGFQILCCFCHFMVIDLYYLAAISFFCQIHQYFVKIHWCGTNDYSGMLIDFQEEALYKKKI